MFRSPGLGAVSGLMLVAATAGACGGTSPSDSPDAGEDASADADVEEDATPPLDAGRDTATDAPIDSPDPPDGFCAKLTPKPKFCDDFDDGNLTDDWDVVTVATGSEMDLDPVGYTSMPASYAVFAPAKANTEIGNVHLRATRLGAVSHPVFAFNAYFPVVALTTGVVAIATLDVSNNHFFTLYLRDGISAGATLVEETAGVTTRHALASPPVAGAWTRIVVDLDFTAGKANVTFGATKVLDDATIAAVPGTEATFRLGAVYVYGPTDAFAAGYDDVVVDF